MARLGESCSHVATLLWAIEAGMRIRDSMTVTDKTAYWVMPVCAKDVPYSPIKGRVCQKKRGVQVKWSEGTYVSNPIYYTCLITTAVKITHSCIWKCSRGWMTWKTSCQCSVSVEAFNPILERAMCIWLCAQNSFDFIQDKVPFIWLSRATKSLWRMCGYSIRLWSWRCGS